MWKKYRSIILFTLAIAGVSFVIHHSREKPTIFLFGDSPVRNGSLGNVAGGLWGWQR